MSDGERLQAQSEEVRYEANVWGNVSRAVEDIVGLAGGLRLTRESFDSHFFGEAVRGHNEVAQKVIARCTEGVVVTKKFETLLNGFADHYASLAARSGRTMPAPRPLPVSPSQPMPSQQQDNLRARLGLPSPGDLENTLKAIHERCTSLAEKLREMSRVANERIAQLESFLWRNFMPRAAIMVRIIREVVTQVLRWTAGFLEVVNWVVQQARLPIAMYDDAVKWLAMRNKTNEINTWLSVNVLNPERGLPTNLRQQAWTGVAEQAYAAAIPGQDRAASSIGLMSMVTGGSLMGCFGAQVYVFSVLSSAIVDIIKLVADITTKIASGTLARDSFDMALNGVATWLKNIKEGGLAILQAEATSKFNGDLTRVLTLDNSAFAYRADLQLYSSVSQLPAAWPDPTRAGSPWPRQRRASDGSVRWDVSRDPGPTR